MNPFDPFHNLDEDNPLWCVNEQIKDALTGGGAPEDIRHMIEFFEQTGLPKGTAYRVVRAICCAECENTKPERP